MPTAKVLKRRGATVTVAAYGEVLFTPGQVVDRWTKRFSRRVTDFASQAAPSHGEGGKWPGERTLRPHNRGLPLKKSFTSTTQANPALMRVDAAVGNRAPYSLFVDQGTGVFNPEGGVPYRAKVLPPWRQGEGSLYEATWTPGKRQVNPVMIQGQKGQNFMEKGLKRAFESMMRRAYQVADPKVGRAMAFFPQNLALRGTGNTPNDAAFQASLAEWRRWRDDAFRRGDQLGRGQREGRTRRGYLDYRQAQADADAANESTRTAAEQRAAQQAASLRLARERKREGREKRDRERREAEAKARAEAQDRADRQGDAARARIKEATAFANSLRQKGIFPVGRWTTNEKGARVFRVTYTQNGMPKRKDF